MTSVNGRYPHGDVWRAVAGRSPPPSGHPPDATESVAVEGTERKDDASQNDRKRDASKIDVARRVAALVVAGGCIAVLLVTIFTDHQVCQDAFAPQATSGSEQSCGPAGIAVLSPFLVLIALLLLPDITEVGIGGFFSLKMRVEQTAHDQTATAEGLRQLRQEVSSISIAQSRATAQNDIKIEVVSPQGVSHSVDEKARQFAREPPADVPEDRGRVLRRDGDTGREDPQPADLVAGGGSPGDGGTGGDRSRGEDSEHRPAPSEDHVHETRWPPEDSRRWRSPDAEELAATGYEVLEAWSRLAPYIDAARGRRVTAGARFVTDPPTRAQRAELAVWYELFEREISGLREIRNAVAHPPHSFTADDLRRASNDIHRITDLLEGKLEPLYEGSMKFG